MTGPSGTDGSSERSVQTVLVVDDNADIRDTYGLLIGDSYELVTAADAEAGLEQFDASVDIAFVDQWLPGMNGDELIAQVRAEDYRTPIVMTSVIDADDRPEADYDLYLTKPIEEAQIRDLIERYTS